MPDFFCAHDWIRTSTRVANHPLKMACLPISPRGHYTFYPSVSTIPIVIGITTWALNFLSQRATIPIVIGITTWALYFLSQRVYHPDSNRDHHVGIILFHPSVSTIPIAIGIGITTRALYLTKI